MADELAAPAVLEVTGLAVQRGSNLALADAALTVTRPGEVHALLGQNGSGKSTLLGVLSGQLRPLRGDVRLGGEPLKLADTATSRHRGIATVSQERALALDLSVAENVLMGRGLVRRGGIDWRRSIDRAGALLGDLGFDLDPRRRVGDLRPDRQQLVEIARAVAGDPRLLILDEPTSSLTRDEVTALFAVVRRLSARGVSTIVVSHRLAELYEICDRITVLRDGRTVLQAAMSDTTADDLIEAMVGSAPEQAPTPTAPDRSIDRPGVLAVRGLAAAPMVKGVDLEVRAGEIVGVTGLAGAGCSELLEVLAGGRDADAGTLVLQGDAYAPHHARDALDRRVAYLPPDRKTQGLHLSMSIVDNLALPLTRSRPRAAPPRRREELARARDLVARFRVRAGSTAAPVGTLSGGNQQKIAIGKCIEIDPVLLVLDEPTRGVDIAARRDIHAQLQTLAAHGIAVVIASGDVDELREVCERIVVLNRGRVAGEVEPRASDERAVAQLAGGEL